MDYDSCKFYEFLQKHPGLSQKIASQEKYDFKNTQANVEKIPGAMSIDTEYYHLFTIFMCFY